MADDPIENFRLFLMQDLLPVGVAVVDRARKGGTSKVVEPFTSSDDPFQLLRQEGESSAKTLREQLDKVSPGLGNPVVPVNVAVEVDDSQVDELLDDKSLMQCLQRIHVGMEELDNFLMSDDRARNSSHIAD